MFTTAGHIEPVNTVMAGQCLPCVLSELQRTSAFFKQTAKTESYDTFPNHNMIFPQNKQCYFIV